MYLLFILELIKPFSYFRLIISNLAMPIIPKDISIIIIFIKGRRFSKINP